MLIMNNLFTLLFFILPINIYSQEMIVDWDECFGATGLGSISYSIETNYNSDIITSVLVSGDNEAFTNYHGDVDSWILILDEFGNILKERCFGGSARDYIYDIEITEEYIYLIGQTHSTDGDVQSEPIGGYGNLWVVKTDFDLNIIWERQYGCLGTQRLETAKITPEGGLLLLMDFFNGAGGDVSQYYGATDIWISEIDSSGELLWEKTLGNVADNKATDIILKDDGNIVVSGVTNGTGGMIEGNYHGGFDIWMAELNGETKDIIWQNCYGGSSNEFSWSIIEDEFGYFAVGGTKSTDGDVESNFHGVYDAWVIQIDNEGHLIWEHCFGGTDIDSFRNIYKTDTGGYFLFGGTTSEDGDVSNTHCPYANCYANTWVVELDSGKNILWNKVYGPIGYHSWHEKNAIKRIGERDFIIAGVVEDSDIHTGDVDCEPYPVNDGSSAWLYRLYDPEVGILNYKHNLSLNCYPNPAKTQITFELPVSIREGRIQIRDVFGNTIIELPVLKGLTELQWNCSQLSSGVYFYYYKMNDIQHSGKFVIY